jgi:hypothetical protein
MLWPISKSALDRLGVRMAAGEQIAAADLEQFEVVSATCDEAASRMASHLSDLGYYAVPRAKTTGTLVDKLRRQHTRLSQVQDLAGVRFVVTDRLAQDEAVAAVRHMCQTLGYDLKVDDLRNDPSYGYRAVHVIVFVGQVPVEVQVRTELQDSWAQIVEFLGDRWGRGIRYGQGPEQPDIIVGGQGLTRRRVLELLMNVSESIVAVESLRVQAAEVEGMQERFDQLRARYGQEREDALAGTLDFDPLVAALALPWGENPPQELQAFRAGWRDLPVSEALDVVARLVTSVRGHVNERQRESEQGLRDILQRIAATVDEAG